MNNGKKDWREKWTSPILLLCLFLGIILIIPVNFYDYELWSITRDIGIALLIAGALGLTVDKLLRYQLAKDAFKASIGYLLPDELKPEMEWVYQQEIIAIKHRQICKLTPLGNDLVVMRVSINRTFQNVSQHRAKLKPLLSIDEWFHKERESKILGFGWTGGREDFECEKEVYTLSVKNMIEIELAPKETVETWCSYEEIKHSNDQHISTFIHVTDAPFVEVESFNGLVIKPGFTMHYQHTLKQVGNNRYELAGALLPGQPIIIRWYKSEDSQNWAKREINEKSNQEIV